MLRVSYKKVYGYFYIKNPNGNTFKCAMHPANCLFAVCYHYVDETNTKMVQLVSFFCDIEHLKRCYKPNDSIDNLERVTLYSNCPEFLKVAKVLTNAKIPVNLRWRKK